MKPTAENFVTCKSPLKPSLCALSLACPTLSLWLPDNKLRHRPQVVIRPLRTKLLIATHLELSSLCTCPVYKSLKTKKMWRIGREVQMASLFLFVVNINHCLTFTNLHSRLASSRPRSLLSSPSAIRTCSKIPTSPPSFSSNKYLNNCRTPQQVTTVVSRASPSQIPSSFPRR